MGFFAVEIYIIQNQQIQILFFPLWGPPLGGPVSDSHINLYYLCVVYRFLLSTTNYHTTANGINIHTYDHYLPHKYELVSVFLLVCYSISAKDTGPI